MVYVNLEHECCIEVSSQVSNDFILNFIYNFLTKKKTLITESLTIKFSYFFGQVKTIRFLHIMNASVILVLGMPKDT